MNIVRSKQMAMLTLILAILSLFSSIMGTFVNNIYQEVFEAGTIPKPLIWGSVAQDIISIPLAFILGLLSISYILSQSFKKFISLIGITGYFFYGFGLYVIQGQYTSIYIIYLIIWSLSIYSIILGMTSFTNFNQYKLPKVLRKVISGYFIFILVILVPGWIIRMIPDIQAHIPGDTYGVYILDLTIVFPAFGITTYLLLRNKGLGNVLSGIALFKGFTLCLSWAFSQITGPFVGNPLEIDMIIISSALTIIGLILTILYFKNINKG